MRTQGAGQGKQCQGLVKIHAFLGHAWQKRGHFWFLVLAAVAKLHVGTEPSCLQIHRFAGFRVTANGLVAGSSMAQQFDGLFCCKFVRRHILREAGAAFAVREKGSVAANANFVDRILWPVRWHKAAGDTRINGFLADLHQALQPREIATEIEVLQVILIPRFSPRDHVEIILQLGGELVIQQFLEVQFQHAHHGHRNKCGHQRSAFFEGVGPAEHQLHNRGPRARTPNAQPFQFLDQASFGVARRGLRGLVLRIHHLGS